MIALRSAQSALPTLVRRPWPFPLAAFLLMQAHQFLPSKISLASRHQTMSGHLRVASTATGSRSQETIVASFLVRAASEAETEAVARDVARVAGASVRGVVGCQLVVLGECTAKEEALADLTARVLAVPGVVDLSLVSAFTDPEDTHDHQPT